MSSVTVYDSKYEPFSRIEWDFAAASQDASANIHPYPARFINDIPRELIKLLRPEDGGLILDPFCGSGTTLVEAQNAGMRSMGIDLNPIACLISRVRTSDIPASFLETAETIASRAESMLKGEVAVPVIPNLDHWFKADVQRAIAALLAQINEIGDGSLADPLRLALSSIIVRVSNQESDTRYAAVDKSYGEKDVISAFLAACRKIDSAVGSRADRAKAAILCRDVLTAVPDEIGRKVSLVITSPPYPNAYEYWLYHKYRMWWLGYDPIHVRSFEIGARPNYHKKNGQTAEDFERQMSKVFDLFVPILTDDAHVCFVIGRSIIRGQEVDNAELIGRVAAEHGLRLKVDIERAIAPAKKSFNLKYGKIKTENILVFGKGSTCR